MPRQHKNTFNLSPRLQTVSVKLVHFQLEAKLSRSISRCSLYRFRLIRLFGFSCSIWLRLVDLVCYLVQGSLSSVPLINSWRSCSSRLSHHWIFYRSHCIRSRWGDSHGVFLALPQPLQLVLTRTISQAIRIDTLRVHHSVLVFTRSSSHRLLKLLLLLIVELLAPRTLLRCVEVRIEFVLAVRLVLFACRELDVLLVLFSLVRLVCCHLLLVTT